MKKSEKSKIGKKSRAEGKAFEPRVREDLENKGWIVNRWNNDVEFEPCTRCTIDGNHPPNCKCNLGGKLIHAKTKWRHTPRGMMPMNLSPGFPDYMAFKFIKMGMYGGGDCYQIIGVECKTNGKIDKLEKEKCQWYLDNKVFSKILVSSKTKVKNKIVVVYEDFEEKYGRRI
jgi:hypothetical protein